eukprot:6191416-Pleurochrysis_carterae.AAC.2
MLVAVSGKECVCGRSGGCECVRGCVACAACLERAPLPSVADDHPRAQVDDAEVAEPQRGGQRRPQRKVAAAKREEQRERHANPRKALERQICLAQMRPQSVVRNGWPFARSGRCEPARAKERSALEGGGQEGGQVDAAHRAQQQHAAQPEAVLHLRSTAARSR